MSAVEIVGGDYRGQVGRFIRQLGTSVNVYLPSLDAGVVIPLKHVRLMDTKPLAESYTPIERHGALI